GVFVPHGNEKSCVTTAFNYQVRTPVSWRLPGHPARDGHSVASSRRGLLNGRQADAALDEPGRITSLSQTIFPGLSWFSARCRPRRTSRPRSSRGAPRSTTLLASPRTGSPAYSFRRPCTLTHSSRTTRSPLFYARSCSLNIHEWHS